MQKHGALRCANAVMEHEEDASLEPMMEEFMAELTDGPPEVDETELDVRDLERLISTEVGGPGE